MIFIEIILSVVVIGLAFYVSWLKEKINTVNEHIEQLEKRIYKIEKRTRKVQKIRPLRENGGRINDSQ